MEVQTCPTRPLHKTTIRIMVVEDHPMTREGIVASIQAEPDLAVVGQAADPIELYGQLPRTKLDHNPDALPHVILLDINLGRHSGIALAQDLHRDFPTVGLLALTMYDEEEFIVQMAKAGVSGYLLKTSTRIELVEAVRTIAAGETFFPQYVSQILLGRFRKTPRTATRLVGRPAGYDELSPRERDVMALVIKNLNNQQIAERLCISERTVENHKSSIFRKLGIRNSPGLIKFAYDYGLV